MPLRAPGETRLQRRAVVLAGLMLSALLLISTRSENTGDSVDYARDVASAPSIATRSLFEPGHLLWRPIGVLLRGTLGQSSAGDAAATRDAQRSLTVVAICAVALLTVSMGLLVLETVGLLAAAVSAMVMTAFGAAVANFGQAGTPYIPGIALVASALCLGTLGQKPVRHVRAAFAGVVLAAGVLVWLPYVLIIPASLLAVYLAAPGEEGHHRRPALVATAACAFVGVGAYVTAAAAMNIRSITAFVGWVAGSSHGISRPGLARVLIGLPRSFVHMGNDGREIRRYLLGDSLNPVSAVQVMVLPVWPRLLVFYSVLAAVMWYALQRPKGRNLLLVFIVALVPVAALGAAWSGGRRSAIWASSHSCCHWLSGPRGQPPERDVASSRVRWAFLGCFGSAMYWHSTHLSHEHDLRRWRQDLAARRQCLMPVQ